MATVDRLEILDDSECLSVKDRLEHEADLLAQSTFGQAIDELRREQVYEMPALADGLSHTGRISRQNDTSLEEGLYVVPKFRDILTERVMPNRLGFVPQAAVRVGKEDSRRKVFFGALSEQWFHNGSNGIIQVAIKPFTRALRETAVHEFAMYEYLATSGIRTIRPLGMLALQSHADDTPRTPSIFMISQFEPNLTTMDNISWADIQTEDAWDRLKTGLQALAELHSKLIFHGDFKFRNIGYDQLGQSVVVDTELSVSTRDLENITDPEKRIQQLMGVDFSDFCLSVGATILNPKKNPDLARPLSDIEKFEQEIEHIYLPYFDLLTHTGSEHLPILHAAFNRMIEQKTAAARGEAIPS